MTLTDGETLIDWKLTIIVLVVLPAETLLIAWGYSWKLIENKYLFRGHSSLGMKI